jgi:short subunit dehydrogenase-like uncharacterized protein
MSKAILIYGSYGYTGELIVDLAVAAGAKPILAGRSADKVETQAALHGGEHRVFGVDDPDLLIRGLEGVGTVLDAMAEACLHVGAHYLDITGEVAVFESMKKLHARAQDAGIMIMPGTGFDVVPTDCLALHLKNRLPDATELTLAFTGQKTSRGTAMTMVEGLAKGGLIRQNGVLTEVPSAWKTRDINFGEGTKTAMTIPWGDVSTAFHSTGIPNIVVYMAAPPGLQRAARISRYLGWLLAMAPIQSLLKGRIKAGPAGPSDQEREAGRSLIWGEVRNADGKSVESRLLTPDAYTLTAQTAWEIAKRAAAGNVPNGYQTPASAFGADFILEFPGVERTDL